MQKFKCNCCGRVYDLRLDALECHPDVTSVYENDFTERAAEQRNQVVGSIPTASCETCKHRDVVEHSAVVDCPGYERQSS